MGEKNSFLPFVFCRFNSQIIKLSPYKFAILNSNSVNLHYLLFQCTVSVIIITIYLT